MSIYDGPTTPLKRLREARKQAALARNDLLAEGSPVYQHAQEVADRADVAVLERERELADDPEDVERGPEVSAAEIVGECGLSEVVDEEDGELRTDGGVRDLPFTHEYTKLQRDVFPTIRRRKQADVGALCQVRVGEPGDRQPIGVAKLVALEQLPLVAIPTALLAYDTDVEAEHPDARERALDELNQFYQNPLRDDEEVYLHWCRWETREVDLTQPMTDGGRIGRSPLVLGSIVLDATQNKPMQVVGVDHRNASDHPNVDVDDPIHRELGVTPTDPVFDCVFLPDGDDRLSTPTKTYAYPWGRLTRVPVEAALPEGARRIHTQILVEFLASVFAELQFHGADEDIERVAEAVTLANQRIDAEVPTEVLVEEALELADVERLAGGGD